MSALTSSDYPVCAEMFRRTYQAEIGTAAAADSIRMPPDQPNREYWRSQVEWIATSGWAYGLVYSDHSVRRYRDLPDDLRDFGARARLPGRAPELPVVVTTGDDRPANETLSPEQIATLLSHYYIAPSTGPQWHTIMVLHTLQQVAELCYERIQHEARHYTVGQPDPSYIGTSMLPGHFFAVGSGAHYDQLLAEMSALLADERPSYRVESYGASDAWVSAVRLRHSQVASLDDRCERTSELEEHV